MAHTDRVASLKLLYWLQNLYSVSILLCSERSEMYSEYHGSNPLCATDCNDGDSRGFLWTLCMSESVVLRLLPSKYLYIHLWEFSSHCIRRHITHNICAVERKLSNNRSFIEWVEIRK
jgi:hypothetical protein